MLGIRHRLKVRRNQTTKDGFVYRGVDNTRIETLSDGVFAIAIGLLLISSDTPDTFAELKEFMVDFVPFGATICLLMIIWYQHYLFFIRYGLKDATTVAVNTVLLFLILFYVYPLKFLMQVLYWLSIGIFTSDQTILDQLFSEKMPLGESPDLMVYYGFGAVAIFITIAALYLVALRKAKALKLSKRELFETKASIGTNLLLALPPALSLGIAYVGLGDVGTTFSLSGVIYMIYPVVMIPYGVVMRKRTKKLFG